MTELGESGRFETIGSSDLATLLGLERQKALMNCKDESGCMAELSASLGAPWVVTGKLTRAGRVTRLDLKLIHTTDGQVAWRGGRELADESDIFGAVRSMVPSIAQTIDPVAPSQVRAAPLVLSGAGLLGVLVGGGLSFFTWNDARQYAAPGYRWPAGTPVDSVLARQQSANTTITIGLSVAAVGGAALISGLLWYFLGKPAHAEVTR